MNIVGSSTVPKRNLRCFNVNGWELKEKSTQFENIVDGAFDMAYRYFMVLCMVKRNLLTDDWEWAEEQVQTKNHYLKYFTKFSMKYSFLHRRFLSMFHFIFCIWNWMNNSCKTADKAVSNVSHIAFYNLELNVSVNVQYINERIWHMQ